MNEKPETPIEDEAIEHALAILTEHFDSVQIFGTRLADDRASTLAFTGGSGDWYARYGLVREWVLGNEAAAIRAKHENQ